MRTTMTILERHLEELVGIVFSVPECEGAAYLLCRRSHTGDEQRLLVREVVPVRPEDYLVREPFRLSINSDSYARVAKRAAAERLSILFVHSHPGGYEEFSDQDDREEPKLMHFLQARAPDLLHGSLVLSSPEHMRARVWVGQSWEEMERVRVVGRRIRLLGRAPPGSEVAPFFDRQVRAFGPDIQRLLARLHVGVVGAGGTGSAVAEQLARLGVGTLSIFDGDTLEGSNVTRVYGSRISQAGRNKAENLGDYLRAIGLVTDVRTYPEHINKEDVAKRLRECDVVFGCTDKEYPRSILVEFSLRYLTPVFDTGVVIDSKDGEIRGVTGRVTTILPGEACLLCRRRITPERIRAEQLPEEERRRLVAEGYAPELETRNPAVVMFTTAVACQAISEFMHRLTGFMGEERFSTEVLQFFHETVIRRNRPAPGEECLCSKTERWGAGDSRDFLDMMWAA